MTDYVKPPQNRPVLVADPDARRDVVDEEGTAEETAKRELARRDEAQERPIAGDDKELAHSSNSSGALDGSGG
ncbi:hypothetical protein J2W23_005817 [Variovorax boronicumulans]|uniref:hypothetical protein n=1 Tax=Variovorax boronicumulans TaxID=436515 RepID=UPI00159D5D8A|nr:hypothetical protein [Variovorax boronicumulans]MDQ0017404.1 hypothetical protein [Variovorax boronicumulans]